MLHCALRMKPSARAKLTIGDVAAAVRKVRRKRTRDAPSGNPEFVVDTARVLCVVFPRLRVW